MTTSKVHPAPEQLEAFVHGQLPSGLRNEVVRHLLHGCPDCTCFLAAAAAPIFDPSLRQLPLGGDEAYEFPVRRAFYSIERRSIALSGARANAEIEIGSLYANSRLPGETDSKASQPLLFARAEAWLRHAKALRPTDAQAMEVAAIVGACVADGLEPRQHPPGTVFDLQAQLWAELGYARRLTGDLAGGGAALGRAVRSAGRGSGDLQILTKIAEIVSSHRVAGREFEDSKRILEWVLAAYVQNSDLQQAGKALVLLGLTSGYAGNAEEAVSYFSSALRWIDGAKDPRLAFAAIHNLLWFSAEIGRFSFVARLIGECRKLYREVAQPLDRLKFHWMCARCAAEEGDSGAAEFRFREVRRSFEERGMPYLTALVSLDLGVVLLERGRSREALELVEETTAAFVALGIERESLAALVLLAQSLGQERASAALFRRAAAEVKRLEASRG